jgi:hypothetical protein
MTDPTAREAEWQENEAEPPRRREKYKYELSQNVCNLLILGVAGVGYVAAVSAFMELSTWAAPHIVNRADDASLGLYIAGPVVAMVSGLVVTTFRRTRDDSWSSAPNERVGAHHPPPRICGQSIVEHAVHADSMASRPMQKTAGTACPTELVLNRDFAVFHAVPTSRQLARFRREPSPAALRFGRDQIKTRATTDDADFTDKTMQRPAEFATACAGFLYPCDP